MQGTGYKQTKTNKLQTLHIAVTCYRFGIGRWDTSLSAILVETCMENDHNTVLLMYDFTLELLVTKKKKEFLEELVRP